MNKFNNSTDYTHRFGFIPYSTVHHQFNNAIQVKKVEIQKEQEEIKDIPFTEKKTDISENNITSNEIQEIENILYPDIYVPSIEPIPEKKPELVRSKSKMSDIVSNVIFNMKVKKTNTNGWNS